MEPAEQLPIEQMTLVDMDEALVAAGVYERPFSSFGPGRLEISAVAREALSTAVISHLYKSGLIISLSIEVLPAKVGLVYTCALHRSLATEDETANIVYSRGRSSVAAVAGAALNIKRIVADEGQSDEEF